VVRVDVGRRTAHSLDVLAEVEFVVDQAGCSSCADRIRTALEAVATVHAIEIDEEADAASVRLRSPDPISEEAVGRLLSEAAGGSGHEYRVQPGSWRALRA
jgi:copper chaperone CopZ